MTAKEKLLERVTRLSEDEADEDPAASIPLEEIKHEFGIE